VRVPADCRGGGLSWGGWSACSRNRDESGEALLADKLMGAGFGVARGIFVCVAVITAIVAFAPGKDEKSPPESVVGSRIAPYMIDAAHTLTAAAPRELARRIRAPIRAGEADLGADAETRARRLPESEIIASMQQNFELLVDI